MKNFNNMPLPWKRFRDFIAPDIDRFAVLKNILDEVNIENSIITISGNRHFFISPPKTPQPAAETRQTILVAHYDRSPGSPGANDNSAAVFILIETALKLLKNSVRNWYMIFTDKEELTGGEGIRDQGAYTLARGLLNAGLENARIYNFDACGAGDTLIISTTAEHLLKNEGSGKNKKIRSSIRDLREFALEKARQLGMGKVLLAPTPFSDDAGFLHAGLAAQTITILPSGESTMLISTLRRYPGFTKVLVNHESRNARSENFVPETWRIFNTSLDSHLRLTPENFYTVLCFAEALCKG